MSELKILIIDDCPQKIARICSHIDATHSGLVIDVSDHAKAGYALIAKGGYALVLLDVLLPTSKGDTPSQAGSIWLLNEVSRKLPLEQTPVIVGITQFFGQIPDADDVFRSQLWSIINMSGEDDRWVRQVGYAIRFAKSKFVEALRAEKAQIDVAIVTALRSPEFNELIDVLGGGDSFHIKETGEMWLISKIVTKSGKELNVIAACADEMGICSMASLVTRIAFFAEPKHLILCGIMGGNPKRVGLGDVILIEKTWDCHAGKITDEGFEADMKVQRCQLKLVNVARSYFSSDLLMASWKRWKGQKPDKVPQFLVGAVACSPCVLAKDGAFDEIENQKRKVLGVEMEAFGCYDAAHRLGDIAPKVISIKSVCDLGDKSKSDHYQSYSAYLSASLAVDMIKNSEMF